MADRPGRNNQRPGGARSNPTPQQPYKREPATDAESGFIKRLIGQIKKKCEIKKSGVETPPRRRIDRRCQETIEIVEKL